MMTPLSLQIFPCVNANSTLPIVLLNGWGMSASVWQSLVPELQKVADVHVVEFSTYELSVDYLCQQLHQQLPEKVFLCGWSLGGMIATQLADRYPQTVAGLVTLASNAQYVADDSWPAAMSADVFDTFFHAIKQTPEKTLQRFMGLVAQGDSEFKEQRRFLKDLLSPMLDTQHLLAGLSLLREINNQEALKRISCPALHFFGELDVLVPIGAMADIQQLNAQHHCIRIEHAGHLLHMPAARVANDIIHFLQKNS